MVRLGERKLSRAEVKLLALWQMTEMMHRGNGTYPGIADIKTASPAARRVWERQFVEHVRVANDALLGGQQRRAVETMCAVVPLCEALRLCGSSVHPVEVDVTWVKADPDALWIETEGPRRRFDPSRLFRPGQLRRFTLRIAFPGEPGGTYRPATGVLVTHDNGELTYHLSASEAQLLVAMGQTRWVLEVRRAQAHGRAYGEHG